MNQQQFCSLIDAIYEAALAPDTWTTVLERLSDDLMGGTPVVLGITRLSGDGLSAPVMYSARVNPHITQMFIDHYSTPEANPFVEALPRLPTNRYVPDQLIMPETEKVRTSLYRDMIRAQGQHHTGFVVMPFDGDWQGIMNLGRRVGMEQLDEREAAPLNALIPHISRALQIQYRLNLVCAERDATHAALDRLEMGVLLLDFSGKVIHMNRSASAIVAESDGLTCRAGRLCAASRFQAATLDRLVARAASTGSGTGFDPGGSLSISRPSMRRALAVLVAPLGGPTRRREWAGPAAVVFVTDPESNAETPPEVLVRLFGLTAAEARITMLVLEGMQPQDIAETLRVTIATVRTHLRHVFQKTGTRRQTELVTLLLKGMAALDWCDP